MERRVWVLPRAGNLERLELRTEILPPPPPGSVRVSIESVGLNFADVFACLGLYSATPRGAFTPGLEYAGVVEEISRGTKTKFRRGDRVMGLTRFGAYASHVNADPRYLVRLPAKWTFPQGAAFLAQGLTAYYAIVVLGAAKRGHLTLVHSAAGGVGLISISILRALGALPIATIGSPAKINFLREQCGLENGEIILRDAASFPDDLDRALRLVDRPGFDLILDSVMGRYFRAGFTRLVPQGRLVLFGAADMTPHGSSPNFFRLALQYLRRPRLDPLAMISSNQNVMAFNLIWLWDHVEELRPMVEGLVALHPEPPYVGHEYDFSDAVKALQFFQKGTSVGKVVLNT